MKVNLTEKAITHLRFLNQCARSDVHRILDSWETEKLDALPLDGILFTPKVVIWFHRYEDCLLVDGIFSSTGKIELDLVIEEGKMGIVIGSDSGSDSLVSGIMRTFH